MASANKLLILTVCASMLFGGCYDPDDESSGCPNPTSTFYDLSADDLAKVPYTGFDTLYFKDKQGDTAVVAGGGKTFYDDLEYVFNSGGPACLQDTLRYRAYKIFFRSLRGNLDFTFEQRRLKFSATVSRNKYLPYYFTAYYPGLGQTSIYPDYIDSLTINGVKYGRIDIENGYDRPVEDTTYRLLINQSHGVLSISSKMHNEEYTLLKIK
jgi:hypothetical protein